MWKQNRGRVSSTLVVIYDATEAFNAVFVGVGFHEQPLQEVEI